MTIIIQKMGVSLKCACALQLAAVTIEAGLLIFCACADNHVHCCLSIKWVDQGVVYLFDYPAFSYPACLWNQSVLIIEVLLYRLQVLYITRC